ncbi:hypothetical protein ACIREE_31800 [Streptomyces sp. NPDC102467]|uniref:hypothetical protein n=1 Tax=Streptomyces sp. NPDC102467 TaxID=3366179 RepID=UPI00380E937A
MEDSAREDRLLMMAVSGEPLPDSDPDAAEVAADVALLREQVRGLGDALAAHRTPEPMRAPVSVPLSVPVRRRRPLRLALGGLAVAGGLGVASVMVWAVLQSGGGIAASSGDDKSAADNGKAAGGESADLSPEGFVACSRVIAEGTVVKVEQLPGTGQDRITLRVTRYIKPESGGAKTLTFPMDHDVDPRLKTGDRPLITIPEGGRQPDNWSTGKDSERLRAMVLKALPGSHAITCDKGPGPQT